MTRLALLALLALASGARPAKASRCYWSICHLQYWTNSQGNLVCVSVGEPCIELCWLCET